MTIDIMKLAYIEAIYFTDTGDGDQPAMNADLSAYDKAKAYIDCRNFFWAVTDELGVDRGDIDWHQAGIDLWLTRNGHGTGFWDRPELYGKHTKTFTALAKAMGTHEATFEE